VAAVAERVRPVLIKADEFVVQLDDEKIVTFREVPVIFDTSGSVAVMLLDARPFGGPVLSLGLASTTTYAVAMALMQMRARLRREAKAQTSPSPRSMERA
jgi:hypothetical protein